MRKKQWVAAALVGLAVILVGVGSGNVKTRQTKKDKQENTQIVSGVQIVTEDGKKYYDFQDVKENITEQGFRIKYQGILMILAIWH